MEAINFEPGSKWRMRGGQIATVYGAALDPDHIVAYYGDKMSVFTASGRYWFHDEESEFDLIEPADAALASAEAK